MTVTTLVIYNDLNEPISDWVPMSICQRFCGEWLVM